MGVDVEYVDLGTVRHGEYHDPDLILLNARCTEAQMLAALAHEVGHAVYRETGRTANCSRADEYGAALVISEGDYAEAEALVGHHPGAMARHLGVTRRLILAWQRWFHRTQAPVRREGDPLP